MAHWKSSKSKLVSVFAIPNTQESCQDLYLETIMCLVWHTFSYTYILVFHKKKERVLSNWIRTDSDNCFSSIWEMTGYTHWKRTQIDSLERMEWSRIIQFSVHSEIHSIHSCTSQDFLNRQEKKTTQILKYNSIFLLELKGE